MVKKRSSAHQLRLLTSQVENFWSINKSSTVHQWNTLIDSRLNFFFCGRLSHPNLPGVGEVLLMIFHPSEALSFLLEDCPIMFLMEEIMYHLLSMKPCEKWDIDLKMNWCRIPSINSRCHQLAFPMSSEMRSILKDHLTFNYIFYGTSIVRFVQKQSPKLTVVEWIQKIAITGDCRWVVSAFFIPWWFVSDKVGPYCYL